MREAVAQGLDRAGLLPVGGGYAELSAGARGAGRGLEGYARGELGWHPAAGAALFGFGQAELGLGAPPAWQAGVGARVAW